MKKTALFLVLLLVCQMNFAQKRKASKKGKTPNVTALAKNENATVELISGAFFVSINSTLPKKDTIGLQVFNDKRVPIDTKIQNFTTKGVNLCLVSWTDKYKREAPLTKENITETKNVILDLTNKKKIFSNSSSINLITQIHFLDAKQTVSETIEKKRSEGMVFTLLPNGDISLKSKSREDKYTFDTNKQKYVDSK
jgi:hypothetical protein